MNTIIHKKSKVKESNGQAKLPTSSQLVPGEIAINYANDVETISIVNDNNEIVTFRTEEYYNKIITENEQVTGAAFNVIDGKISAINEQLNGKLDKTSIKGSGATTVSISDNIVTITSTDNKVTDVANHYTPISSTTKSASSSIVTDITNSNGTAVITGLKMDAAGHITDIVSAKLASTDTIYTHPTSSGYKHIPSGGTSGQFLGYSASGTAAWVNNPASGKSDSTHNHGTLKLTGDVTGSTTITSGTGAMTLSTTVTNDSHSHTVATISGGTSGQVMTSQGSSAATWTSPANMTVGKASQLATAREIKLTGAVTGTTSFDGSSGVTINTTVNHNHSFSSLTSKPTTLSGYGITDAVTSSEIADLDEIRTNASNALSTANAVSDNMTIKKGNGSNSALQTPKGGAFTDKNKYSLTTLQEVPADASGDYSVALNGTAAATAAQAVAQGHRCIARGETSHAEGHCAVVDYIDEVQNGYGSHAEGYGTYVIGTYSHAEGSETAIAGNNSHAEGGSTIIEGDFAHAEGYGSFVGDRNNAPSFDIPEGGEGDSGNVTPGPDVTGKKGVAAHAEGNYTIAEGNYSHAEGRHAKTFGEASHAEGNDTITEGNYSHAEGWMSTANGAYSHAEGQYTRTHADAAHSEGNNTDAYAPFSHAEGIGTRTDIVGQHVEGYYNAESDGVLVVGCGTSDEDRKNALDVKQDGRVFVKGVGNYDGTSNEAIDLAGAINNIYEKTETYNKTEIDNILSNDYYTKSQTNHQISSVTYQQISNEINKLATVAKTGSYNDLKNKPTIVTDVKVNGTSLEQVNGAVNITAASLGLSRVLKYCGITTTELTDGSTAQTVTINGASHKAEAGCVVFYGDKEFVYNGSVWELLGGDSTYKVVQTAVSSPNPSGNATAFIDTISQDANGVITVTKKNVNFPAETYTQHEDTSNLSGSYGTTATTTAYAVKQITVDDKGHVTGIVTGTTPDTKYTHPTTSGNKHIPSGGSNGQFLGWSADGTAAWVANPNTDTKVTSVGNHYAPVTDTAKTITKNASSTTNATWGSSDFITGITVSRDAAGHITDLSVSSLQMPANPNTDTATTQSGHYAPSTTATTIAGGSGQLSHSGTFTVPSLTFDSKGHLVSGTTTTYTLPSDNDTHHVACLRTASSKTATGNTTDASNGIYFNLVENGTVRSNTTLSGTSNVTVTSPTAGTVVITGPGTGTTSTYGLVKITTGDVDNVTAQNGVAAGIHHSHSTYENSIDAHDERITDVEEQLTNLVGEIEDNELVTAQALTYLEGKIDEITTEIEDNEYVTAQSLTDLDARVSNLLSDITGSDGLNVTRNTDTGAVNIALGLSSPTKASISVKTREVPTTSTYFYPVQLDNNGNLGVYPSAIGQVSGTTTSSTKFYPLGHSSSASTTATAYKATNVYVSGGTKVCASGGFYQTSDERKKDFLNDIEIDFEKLRNIPKSYFTWKDGDDKTLQIGTSAQEVQKIYPELVGVDNETGELSLDYALLSIIALKAVDILYEEKQEMKERLDRIEKALGL